MAREATSSSQCGRDRDVILREPPQIVSLKVSFLPHCHYFTFSEHFLTTLMITVKQDSYWQYKSPFQDDTSTYSLIPAINRIIIMTLPRFPFLKKAIQIQIFWLKNIPSSFSSLTQKEVTPALLGNRRTFSSGCTYAVV